MRSLTGNEVRQAVRGRWLSRDQIIPVLGVSINSRTAVPNDLFVAIRGDSFDGHDYLVDAAEKGCIAAIVDVSSPLPPELLARFPVGVIGVGDTRTALLDLGGYYRSVIPCTVVAVTGSNGKTTVKHMINHILSHRLKGRCSERNFNNDIGVPLTLLSAGGGDDYLICEIGTNAPGEISRLARAVRADVGVVTSIAPAHLEGLGSLEQIAVEKVSLFNWLENDKTAIANIDTPEFSKVLKGADARVIRFGNSVEADLRLTAYEQNGWSQKFQINNHQWVELGIPGRHNALNAIASIAACARFGFSQEDSAELLAEFRGVPMIMERLDFGSIKIINDAYNANPASMKAAIDVMSGIEAKRKVVIVGDMLELGESAEAMHHEIGGVIASTDIQLVIGVGQLGSIVARNASRGHCSGIEFGEVQEVRDNIQDLVMEGDLVLLKGSRAMGLDRLVPDLRDIGAEGENNRQDRE